MASEPSSSLNGNGAADRTIASTIRASLTMPITRLISTSLPVKALPSLKLSRIEESAERSSRSIRSGAIRSGQLTSAHTVKNPNDRKISHIE